jgi:hypothetical protein
VAEGGDELDGGVRDTNVGEGEVAPEDEESDVAT